jgi:3-deoxy-D-manno-octulosonic-acid transferase
METELWPNMLNQCHQRGIPVVIANARLSAKSAMGYQKFAALSRHMLHDVHTVAAQNAQDGERFTRLGLAEDKLAITGSIKFDVTLDDDLKARAEALHAQLSQQGKHPLWIAASTHKGEDDTLLLAHQRVRQRYPDIRLLLVPRHPERFDNVYQLAADTGLNVIRRSAASIPADWDIMIGDTMGELLLLLGAADIAFIGGSLVPNGGHNMLEAAVWSKPVITGPHLFNFQEISDLLVNAGGMVVIEDGKALAGQITAWLDEPAKRQQAGEAAVAIVDTNRGALDKLLQCIDAALH